MLKLVYATVFDTLGNMIELWVYISFNKIKCL